MPSLSTNGRFETGSFKLGTDQRDVRHAPKGIVTRPAGNVPWVMEPAAKPENWISILGTHVLEGVKQLSLFILRLDTGAPW